MEKARPLKTVFFLEDLCFGGTQRQTLELASRLNRAIFEPSLLTLTGRADLDDLAEKANLPIRYLGTGRRFTLAAIVRARAELACMRPDILVPCTALPNIWGRIWGKLLKIPVVVGTCRGGGAPSRQHERWLWRLCDGIVCNSPALEVSLRLIGIPDEWLAYVPNGVDTDFFLPQAAEGRLIVCVARLAPDKNHKLLLEAFARVGAEFPDARLRLVGDGPEEKNLKNFTAQKLPAHIAARVEFAGATADTRPHYAAATLLALASDREGQPNAILEAMACGLPVCATNVGGIPTLVTDNGSGLLSEPGDAAALAANISRLLRDPACGAQLGAAGRARTEREFSFGAMVAAHERFFLKLWRKATGGDKP